jgi:hypothetical protein
MGPILEQQSLSIHHPIEAGGIVGPKPAEQGEIVRPGNYVDRIELEAGDRRDKVDQSSSREASSPWPSEMLPLKEEGGHAIE